MWYVWKYLDICTDANNLVSFLPHLGQWQAPQWSQLLSIDIKVHTNPPTLGDCTVVIKTLDPTLLFFGLSTVSRAELENMVEHSATTLIRPKMSQKLRKWQQSWKCAKQHSLQQILKYLAFQNEIMLLNRLFKHPKPYIYQTPKALQFQCRTTFQNINCSKLVKYNKAQKVTKNVWNLKQNFSKIQKNVPAILIAVIVAFSSSELACPTQYTPTQTTPPLTRKL